MRGLWTMRRARGPTVLWLSRGAGAAAPRCGRYIGIADGMSNAGMGVVVLKMTASPRDGHAVGDAAIKLI